MSRDELVPDATKGHQDWSAVASSCCWCVGSTVILVTLLPSCVMLPASTSAQLPVRSCAPSAVPTATAVLLPSPVSCQPDPVHPQLSPRRQLSHLLSPISCQPDPVHPQLSPRRQLSRYTVPSAGRSGPLYPVPPADEMVYIHSSSGRRRSSAGEDSGGASFGKCCLNFSPSATLCVC